MILKKFYLVSLLSVCSFLSSAQADDCSETAFSDYSLCEEFQLIRDLAPETSVINLVQSHMQNDIRFRRACQYMLSSQFKQTTDKIDATATFQSSLSQFTRAGVNTTDIDSVFKIFDCVLIPMCSPMTRSSFHGESVAETRSLDTFTQEVSRLIPTAELVKTLQKQIAENKNFAKFYGVVRDPSFRTQVMQGFKNRDISRPIKTLRHFQIDLSKLVEYAFNLFYLGPDV